MRRSAEDYALIVMSGLELYFWLMYVKPLMPTFLLDFRCPDCGYKFNQLHGDNMFCHGLAYQRMQG